MPENAGLYKVRGPNGVYHAVHDPATGRIWTERSEQSARAQARDAGLDVGVEKSITHETLMRLSGRGVTAMRAPTAASSARSTPSVASAPSGAEPDAPHTPIKSRAPFEPVDPGRPVLTSKSDQGGAVFSSTAPVQPQPPPSTDDVSTPSTGALLNRDVLNEKLKLPGGSGKNPFADRKPKRRSS